VVSVDYFIMLNVVILKVVMLIVVAPLLAKFMKWKKKEFRFKSFFLETYS
jgi:hypothetical protein